ncbi:MAG: ribosome biogenesis GTPase Der [Planctomycetota bacterium]|nr:ribosome biogenesis GTPase Der [Planctomycetota bacterium]MDA1114433.1 ribosome biogenesis GTPase Der [Planctomycetota bacterium]
MLESNKRPLVAIVGRPNVGKSSLFNRMFGDRRAIVEPTAGVTRDRLVLPVRLPDYELSFDLMDTGGIGIVDREDLAASVEYQVLTGITASDLVIFLVDAREGLTLLDEQVAQYLRRSNVEVVMVANKCETRSASIAALEFSALGFGEPQRISAQEGQGFGDFYEHLSTLLPKANEIVEEGRMSIAVLGRRNTGKSSFVNAILGEDRVIVSDLAGTTRDAVDIDLEWQGHALTLVDTAGVHRKGKINSAVEYFSLTRSDQAIRRADLALLFLDLTETVARMDQELARTIVDRHKPTVVVGTKSDLVPDMSIQDFRDLVGHKLPHLKGAPVLMISNVNKKGLDRVLRESLAVYEEGSIQVGTGELNRMVKASFDNLRFRGRGEKPKVMYATQLGTNPPSFLLFVNHKRLFEKEVLRTLTNDLRKRMKLVRSPLRLVLRERERSASKKG